MMTKQKYYGTEIYKEKYPNKKKEKSKGKLQGESQLKKNNGWLFKAEIFD
jgi:hypothetical protein